MSAVDPLKTGDVTGAAHRDEAATRASVDAARKTQNETVKKNQEDFAKHRADQAKLNEETMAKQAGYRPTPSIEELHDAMAGNNADVKEPDGSPEQDIHHRTTPVSTQIEVGHKTSEAKPMSEKSGYQTRETKKV